MRRFLFSCGAVVASSLFAILLIEGGLQIIKRDMAFQPDAELIRSFRPNMTTASYTYETEDVMNGLSTSVPEEPVFNGYVQTNNVGLRMQRDVGPRQPGERRLLLLGDSFTEGVGVRTEQRFSNLLQERLDRDTAGPERWFVINAGIQNGNPSQYVLQLRRYLGEFDPDVVITVTGPNDYADDQVFEKTLGFEFDEDGLPFRIQNALRLKLQSRSYLLRYFQAFTQRYARFLIPYTFPDANPEMPGTIAWQRFACSDDSETHAVFRQKSGKYLRGLRRMTEEAGAEFGVVVIHYRSVFGEAYDEKRWPNLKKELEAAGCPETRGKPYDDFMSGFLEESGIRYRSAYEPLVAAKRRKPEEKLWNFHDLHFSAPGNAVAAEVVHDLFLELKQARLRNGPPQPPDRRARDG